MRLHEWRPFLPTVPTLLIDDWDWKIKTKADWISRSIADHKELDDSPRPVVPRVMVFSVWLLISRESVD
jgi:hypothetical protein